jgi:hypothetical protein
MLCHEWQRPNVSKVAVLASMGGMAMQKQVTWPAAALH